MDNDFCSYGKEEHELSMEEATEIKKGLEAGAGVLTAIGAVIVAIASLISFFSKDN